MTDLAFKAENLGKKYNLRHQVNRNDGLRHVLQNALFSLGKVFNGKAKKTSEETQSSNEDFWALQNVSFEIKQGEVVGIIGRNGAGKSTLLKVLSRITEPTAGRIQINGRVACLLEVGTGFHPELTGRENIYLNGTILGMTRKEIRKKFDEIVAFAEIEKFLDTPVKHYSSGMYVRLAFAVAAHLEPEILVVDEVLAVGDVQFQKKCLGKMQDVAEQEGRTVLFVSHNMTSIQKLCNRVILLDKGQIKTIGKPQDIIPAYLSNETNLSGAEDLTTIDQGRRRGNGAVRFTRIEISTLDGRPAQQILFNETLVVRLQVWAKEAVNPLRIRFSFVSSDGTEVMGTSTLDGTPTGWVAAGINTFSCEIKPMILCPGRYYIRAIIFVASGGYMTYDQIDELIGFDVASFSADDQSAPPPHLVGNVYMDYRWERIESSASQAKVD